MQTSLQGIAHKAPSQQAYRFRNLDGIRNEELRKDCWRAIRPEAADGVDEVSSQADEQEVEGNISPLVERLKRKRYRATLVKRPYIPNENGKLRPLGIQVVEDTLLQVAVTRLLTAIYAQDCLRWSSGYRPHMGVWTQWTN
jgi:RNA-directed DNA polymerase